MAVPYAVATVITQVQALMNDLSGSTYTFSVVRPYLNMALDELQNEFELNNVPVTNSVSSVIPVDAGLTVIQFNADPALPDDLIEIQQLWERNRDTDPWVPMMRVEFLPHYLEGQPINQFLIFSWINQEIHLPESSADNDIKIDYIKDLFPEVEEDIETISVLNSRSYITYKTAALCAQFIGENQARYRELSDLAQGSLDQTLGISAKGGQAIQVRRRPFRTSYVNRRIIA